MLEPIAIRSVAEPSTAIGTVLNGTGPDDGAMVVRHWPR
jgi:hypothetical protein